MIAAPRGTLESYVCAELKYIGRRLRLPSTIRFKIGSDFRSRKMLQWEADRRAIRLHRFRNANLKCSNPIHFRMTSLPDNLKHCGGMIVFFKAIPKRRCGL